MRSKGNLPKQGESDIYKLLSYDSALYKAIVDILLDSITFFDNPKYFGKWNRKQYKECPITKESAIYISNYLHAIYSNRKRKLYHKIKTDEQGQL